MLTVHPSSAWVGLLKSSALRGGARDVLPDERILAGFEIMAAPTAELLRYLYPSLYPISDPAGDWGRPTADGRYVTTTINLLCNNAVTASPLLMYVCMHDCAVELECCSEKFRQDLQEKAWSQVFGVHVCTSISLCSLLCCLA